MFSNSLHSAADAESEGVIEGRVAVGVADRDGLAVVVRVQSRVLVFVRVLCSSQHVAVILNVRERDDVTSLERVAEAVRSRDPCESVTDGVRVSLPVKEYSRE